MKFKISVALLAVASLAACGSFDGVDNDLPKGAAAGELPAPPPGGLGTQDAVSDYPVKIGEPYKVGNSTYTPADVAQYDEVGYASWYGVESAGNATANGEIFNPQAITGAHKTLPLPSYVEVTSLDTGRTILVRINDRGPFSSDRLIDLSQGAARQLGIDGQGVTGVRVRKVNPNEAERNVLRRGGMAIERIETPDSLLGILRKNLAKLPRPAAAARQVAVTPTPRVVNDSGIGASYAPPSSSSSVRPTTPAARSGRFIVEGPGAARQAPAPASRQVSPAPPAPASISNSSYVVQVAAFSSASRANSLASKIGAQVVKDGSENIWRVRYGPYPDENAAQAGLAQARKRGYAGARILRAN